MRKSLFAPSFLAWTLAAVMAVTLPGAHFAWAASASEQLSEQLPGGLTLSRATVSETASALGAAISANPRMALALTETAIMAKTPKRRRGGLSCSSLTKLVGSAINAAPSQSSEIVQLALSMQPGCADSLNALVANPTSSTGNAPSGFNTPEELYGGFGVGVGPGFPGSPGFTGSPPSGAIALPGGDLTSVVNG